MQGGNTFNQLAPSSLPAQNYVDVLLLEVNHFLQGDSTWTSAELNQLHLIASQCYKDGGRAVLFARALHGDPDLYDDEVLCSPNAPLQTANASLTTSWQVLPNPASDNIRITVSRPQKKGSIALSNLQGKVVYTALLPDDAVNFDIQTIDFSPGIYQLTIRDDQGERSIKKISIIK